MKKVSVLAMLLSGLLATAALAQVPAVPPAPAAPPVPAAEAAKPAVPAAPATPAVPGVPGAGKGTAAVGKLFRTERQKNDRGQATWVCTYNVDGNKRAVAMDESCPSELTFEVKR